MENTTEWEQSNELGELFKALSAAQGEIANAAKGSVNPFFKAPGKPEGSKYADLAAIRDAIKEPLAKHGLCVIQQPLTRGSAVGVRTVLGHVSGQYMACVATTQPKDQGPQAYGSCVTYLRRYALSAVTGVAPEDDDGEGAEGRKQGQKPPGANWGKPANGQERSAPKAVAPAKPTKATGPMTTGETSTETGEILDPGQLADLTEAFDTKWGRGARTAAPSWLKAQFGTNDVASLTKSQATEALQKLLAS